MRFLKTESFTHVLSSTVFLWVTIYKQVGHNQLTKVTFYTIKLCLLEVHPYSKFSFREVYIVGYTVIDVKQNFLPYVQ